MIKICTIVIVSYFIEVERTFAVIDILQNTCREVTYVSNFRMTSRRFKSKNQSSDKAFVNNKPIRLPLILLAYARTERI